MLQIDNRVQVHINILFLFSWLHCPNGRTTTRSGEMVQDKELTRSSNSENYYKQIGNKRSNGKPIKMIVIICLVYVLRGNCRKVKPKKLHNQGLWPAEVCG